MLSGQLTLNVMQLYLLVHKCVKRFLCINSAFHDIKRMTLVKRGRIHYEELNKKPDKEEEEVDLDLQDAVTVTKLNKTCFLIWSRVNIF